MTHPRIDQRVGHYHRADAEYCPDPLASFDIEYADPEQPSTIRLTCCDPVKQSYVKSYRDERPATTEEINQCLLKQNARQNWFERDAACPGTEKSAEVEYTDAVSGQTTRVICCPEGASHAVLDENKSVPAGLEHEWVCDEAAKRIERLRKEAAVWRAGKIVDRIPYAIETAGDSAIPPFVRTINRLWLPKTNMNLEFTRRDDATDLTSLVAYKPFDATAPAVVLTGTADRQLSMSSNTVAGVMFTGLRVISQGLETEAPSCSVLSLSDALVSVRYEGPQTEQGLQAVNGTMAPVFHYLERYASPNYGLKKGQQITHDRIFIDPLWLMVTAWVAKHPDETPPEVLAELSKAGHHMSYVSFNEHDAFPRGYNLEKLDKVLAASTNPSCIPPTVSVKTEPSLPQNVPVKKRPRFSYSMMSQAAISLDKKLRNFLENNGMAVPKHMPLVLEKGGSRGESTQEAEDGSTLSGYLPAAFAELIRKQIGQKICIPDLETLDRLLDFQEGEGLFYRSADYTYSFDPNEVANLLLGRVNVLGDKVTLGSLSFYDFNQDGLIRLRDDLIERREMPEVTRYDNDRKTRNVLLSRKRFRNINVFSEVPDFLFNGYEVDDVQSSFERGVPLSDMRQFNNPPPENLHLVKISPDPLGDDGQYRVLIHRYRPGEYWSQSEPGSIGMGFFQWANDFDDVYAFAENEGYLMEDALDRVATRQIPVDYIYVGTHGDAAGLNVTLDTDHSLQMADGGEVVFTGCFMNRQHAAYLASLFFGRAGGTMRWGSGTNVPLLFGGLYSWKGEEFESQIQEGRVIKTVVD